MQAFQHVRAADDHDKGSRRWATASPAAIGAALAHPAPANGPIEGDGGFAQNMQELGTVAVNGLNLKVFLFANEGTPRSA